MSYVVIVAFHPGLNLNRIIIQRSHVHSLKDHIKESHHLETSEKYFKIFQKFIAISIDLLRMLITTIKMTK